MVVTITPEGSCEAELAPRKSVLLTKVRLAAFVTGNGAMSTFSAESRAKPSSVSPARVLNRHDSSVRFGNGRAANVSNAARLRSSHHSGPAERLATCEAKMSGAKLPIGERVVVEKGAGEDMVRNCGSRISGADFGSDGKDRYLSEETGLSREGGSKSAIRIPKSAMDRVSRRCPPSRDR